MSSGAVDDYLTYDRAGTGCLDSLGGGGRDTLALRPSYAAPGQGGDDVCPRVEHATGCEAHG
jgi:hypothetical protein